MSEYQYYEFRAVDRPLDERELRKLRSLSTRAEITPTSFVNTYNWGDFKGSPDALMASCFDAFVYKANWGTRRFALRVPRSLFMPRILSPYCGGESLRARKAGDFVVIDFCSEDDGGDGGEDWEEADRWMDSLIPLRADLLRADYRCLYLGWLFSVQNEELDEDMIEPPVPPGLRSLTQSLDAFVEFLGIDSDLIDAAATESARLPGPPSRDELAAWIRALPQEDKDALLTDAALNAGAQTGAEILRRYGLSRKNDSSTGPQPLVRTVGELLAAADELSSRKARLAAEHEAAERALKAQKEVEARGKYLDQLAGRELDTWQKVERLIQTKQPKKYDYAVSCLVPFAGSKPTAFEAVSFEPPAARMRLWWSTRVARTRFTTSSTTWCG